MATPPFLPKPRPPQEDINTRAQSTPSQRGFLGGSHDDILNIGLHVTICWTIRRQREPSKGRAQENLASWTKIPGCPQQGPRKQTGSLKPMPWQRPSQKKGHSKLGSGNTVLGTASLQMQVTVGLTVRVGIFGFIVCYLFGVCVHAMTHVGEQSEGNLWGLGLPFGIRLRASSLTVSTSTH